MAILYVDSIDMVQAKICFFFFICYQVGVIRYLQLLQMCLVICEPKEETAKLGPI